MAMQQDDIAERLAAARERLVLEHLEARPAPDVVTAPPEVAATLGERLRTWLNARYRGRAGSGHVGRDEAGRDPSEVLQQGR